MSAYQTYNVFLVESKNTHEQGILFPHYAIDMAAVAIVSTKNSGHEFTGFESLTGKTIGWQKGYEFVEPTDFGFTLREFRHMEQAFELLNSGKIDFIICDGEEISEYMQDHAIDPNPYTLGSIPTNIELFPVFGSSNFSRELMAIYHERIPVLLKDGTLERIYKKWGADIPPSILALLN